MNFNNFTIKSQEAIQEAVNLVKSRGQQAIEPVHIMQGVMKVGENVTNFIFQKLGMNGQQVAVGRRVCFFGTYTVSVAHCKKHCIHHSERCRNDGKGVA